MRFIGDGRNLLKSPRLITTLVVIISLLAAFYYYNQYQKVKEQAKKTGLLTAGPTEEAARAAALEAARRENQSLVAKVGALMELPSEEPSVATVVDKEKLKDQAFFEKAENGDKLLIFTGAKKAVLYREKINKIINVAAINIVSQPNAPNPATPSAQAQPSQPKVRVALYNGTKTVGRTKDAEKQLGGLGGFEITAKESASISSYPKTLVIDLSGVLPDRASLIAKAFSGDVSLLPKEEKKPSNSEILVIIGANYKP